MSRLSYFLDATKKLALGAGRSCPNCGSNGARVVERKYLVTYLARCAECQLLFRAPTTSDDEFHRYYQRKYSQGFTTDLPGDDELRSLLERRFKGTEKDYSEYIAVLEALAPAGGRRLFDFGCSWGYGSWQLREAGYQVESLEISVPRAAFAREKLGVSVVGDMKDAKGTYDVFFSSHVLEHIPKVHAVLDLARRIVRPGGLFVAITPNGSLAYRDQNADAWRKSWGFVHPLLLDEAFYAKAFSGSPHVIDSSPFQPSAISAWARTPDANSVIKLSGGELLAAVRL